MSQDYIEVDWYVCGVYYGKRKIGKNSLCGRLLSGDWLGAEQDMKTDLEELGCTVERGV